jgi:hypothetical protein
MFLRNVPPRHNIEDHNVTSHSRENLKFHKESVNSIINVRMTHGGRDADHSPPSSAEVENE